MVLSYLFFSQKGELSMATTSSTVVKRNMRIFGMPPQFTEKVDIRFDEVSAVGNKYMENILLEAPILTIIPGAPFYLPGQDEDDKISLSSVFLEAASSDFSLLRSAFANMAELEDGEVFRYYDFKPAYTEYMSYVNILCRTMAGFLEIRQTLDGTALQHYDWKNYSGYGTHKSTTFQAADAFYTYATTKTVTETDRNGNKVKKKVVVERSEGIGENSVIYQTDVTNKQTVDGTNITNEAVELEEGSILDTIQNYNYIQFFVDVDNTGVNETMSNETATSQLKGAFERGSNLFKELGFIANSGGAGELADKLGDFLDSSIDSLAAELGSGNAVTSVISRLFNVTTNVVKGENVIMPDVYQSSTYNKSYQVTIHLKSLYGTKFGWYMGVGVPLMHLLALGIPKQTTANTYGSPFLVKMFMDGVFVCNLGMVTELTINRSVSENSRTVDGLPNEVDVQMTVADLYSDLTMSPQTNPLLFINNTSLVEYLAINCGLSLTTAQLDTKLDMILNVVENSFRDIPNNIRSTAQEWLDSITNRIIGLIGFS